MSAFAPGGVATAWFMEGMVPAPRLSAAAEPLDDSRNSGTSRCREEHLRSPDLVAGESLAHGVVTGPQSRLLSLAAEFAEERSGPWTTIGMEIRLHAEATDEEGTRITLGCGDRETVLRFIPLSDGSAMLHDEAGEVRIALGAPTHLATFSHSSLIALVGGNTASLQYLRDPGENLGLIYGVEPTSAPGPLLLDGTPLHSSRVRTGIVNEAYYAAVTSLPQLRTGRHRLTQTFPNHGPWNCPMMLSHDFTQLADLLAGSQLPVDGYHRLPLTFWEDMILPRGDAPTQWGSLPSPWWHIPSSDGLWLHVNDGQVGQFAHLRDHADLWFFAFCAFILGLSLALRTYVRSRGAVRAVGFSVFREGTHRDAPHVDWVVTPFLSRRQENVHTELARLELRRFGFGRFTVALTRRPVAVWDHWRPHSGVVRTRMFLLSDGTCMMSGGTLFVFLGKNKHPACTVDSIHDIFARAEPRAGDRPPLSAAFSAHWGALGYGAAALLVPFVAAHHWYAFSQRAIFSMVAVTACVGLILGSRAVRQALRVNDHE